MDGARSSHWQIGGAFVIAAAAALIGLVAFIYCRFADPAFFKKQTLTRATPTLVPDEYRRPGQAARPWPEPARAPGRAAGARRRCHRLRLGG